MHEIKGGNHGQFGIYGAQKGDSKPSISVKKQQDEMVSVTSTWLKENINLLTICYKRILLKGDFYEFNRSFNQSLKSKKHSSSKGKSKK